MTKKVKAPAEPTLAELSDEFGQLQEQLKPLNTIKEHADQIREKILERVGEFPADETHFEEGKRFVVGISARKKERVVDLKPLLAKIGMAKFLKIAKVAIAGLVATVAGSEISKYVIETQTGPRVVTSAPKHD